MQCIRQFWSIFPPFGYDKRQRMSDTSLFAVENSFDGCKLFGNWTRDKHVLDGSFFIDQQSILSFSLAPSVLSSSPLSTAIEMQIQPNRIQHRWNQHIQHIHFPFGKSSASPIPISILFLVRTQTHISFFDTPITCDIQKWCWICSTFPEPKKFQLSENVSLCRIHAHNYTPTKHVDGEKLGICMAESCETSFV